MLKNCIAFLVTVELELTMNTLQNISDPAMHLMVKQASMDYSPYRKRDKGPVNEYR
jgi:hypothetical protein